MSAGDNVVSMEDICPSEIRYCPGCFDYYDAYEESHVGHEPQP